MNSHDETIEPEPIFPADTVNDNVPKAAHKRGAAAARALRRRDVLYGIGSFAALPATATALQALLTKSAAGQGYDVGAGYGPLHPVRDESTGLELLKLPRGFAYTSFGVTGETMSDDSLTPPEHDGMGVIQSTGAKVTLVRNHEIEDGSPFGSPRTPIYERSPVGGGTTTLVFDTDRGRLVEHYASLSGTCRNCSGGVNPINNSWITCEEVAGLPEHGYIFEVPAVQDAIAQPITDAGRFRHEAVAVDPSSGAIYQTEDNFPAGFYRYLPNDPKNLPAGGQLQMLRIAGSDRPRNLTYNQDLDSQAESWDLPQSAAIEVGQSFPVDWVAIDDPKAESRSTVRQGIKKGGAFLSRGEGCFYGNGKIYFISTDGGRIGAGQIWEYDIQGRRLTLILESEDQAVLRQPDNLTMAPSQKALLLCEDKAVSTGIVDFLTNVFANRGAQLLGLGLEGVLFPFAENNIEIPDSAPIGGRTGDYRAHGWAGTTFSPDGRWLFANIQTPGITFAITGPWHKGVFGAP